MAEKRIGTNNSQTNPALRARMQSIQGAHDLMRFSFIFLFYVQTFFSEGLRQGSCFANFVVENFDRKSANSLSLISNM
jgi:hypothetical protein